MAHVFWSKADADDTAGIEVPDSTVDGAAVYMFAEGNGNPVGGYGVFLTPDECESLAAALQQAAGRKRAMDAEAALNRKDETK